MGRAIVHGTSACLLFTCSTAHHHWVATQVISEWPSNSPNDAGPLGATGFAVGHGGITHAVGSLVLGSGGAKVVTLQGPRF